MSSNISSYTTALKTYVNYQKNQDLLNSSLEKISSGLRINSAKDDAAGMMIADSLRMQSAGFAEATKNANIGISLLQMADKALSSQINLADSLKVLAIQAAQDGQTLSSRDLLQKSAFKIIESMNTIASTTSFNNIPLLQGTFTNKEFQIGAYADQTNTLTIGATQSSKIGQVQFQVHNSQIYHNDATLSQTMQIGFMVNGKEVKLQSAVVGYGPGEGLGAVADIINRYSDRTGIKATAEVEYVGYVDLSQNYLNNIQAGTLPDTFSINGVTIGALTVQDNDSDGTLVNAINAVSEQTGVYASLTSQGQLLLNSPEGRAISVTPHHANTKIIGDIDNFMGNLKLRNVHGLPITLSSAMQNSLNSLNIGANAEVNSGRGAGSSMDYLRNLNLIDLTGSRDLNDNLDISGATLGRIFNSPLSAIMDSIDIIDAAREQLTAIHSEIGSMQNQLQSSLNNADYMSIVTKAAESSIRDIDFAQEMANFSKQDILTKAGSFALAQANIRQGDVMRLLGDFEN
ncbi:MAG: flagellin B [Campylobacterales bacterium]|nr:flagellin B [Campylobacterales bacterium]